MTPFGAARTPPPATLRDVLGRLEAAGFPAALGGSGLLAALGLADAVRDWDVTVDAPARRVWGVLRELDPVYVGSSGVHADEKLMLPDGSLECICRFAFALPGGRVILPTRVSSCVDGIPLASPEVWAVAYTLLGRDAKAASLLEHLARTGADPEVVQRLFREPLPPDIAQALALRLRR